MTGIVETAEWANEVRQIETTDAVVGGPGAVANLPHEQLGSRTRYLKDEIEKPATESQVGRAAIATQAEVTAGGDDTKIVTPKKLAARLAAWVAGGAAKWATPRKLTLSGAVSGNVTLDGSVDVTLTTTGVAATDTAAGVVELATPTETTTGTDATRAVTPAGVKAAITALVNAAPGVLDTLGELALALGNDANFAATVTNALAAKAPLASPVLTGSPTAPTPAQFDASTLIASTAFVQRALGNVAGLSSITQTDATLSLAQAGKLIVCASSANQTLTLPSALTAAPGIVFNLVNEGGNGTFTINAASGQTFTVAAGTVSSIKLPPGETIQIVGIGSTTWYVLGGTKQLAYASGFGCSLATSGYQRFPTGPILQWGAITSSAAGDVGVALPLAYPSINGGVWPNSNGGQPYHMVTAGETLSSFNFSAWNTAGQRVATTGYFISIGF